MSQQHHNEPSDPPCCDRRVLVGRDHGFANANVDLGNRYRLDVPGFVFRDATEDGVQESFLVSPTVVWPETVSVICCGSSLFAGIDDRLLVAATQVH